MRKIKSYWIDEIRGVKEFQVLADTEEQELGILNEKIINLIKDQFIITSTEEGVKRREKMLHINPLPNEGLEDRKMRVLNRLLNYMPYNKFWLRNKLTAMLGEDRYQYNIQNNVLRIDTSANEISSIKTLRKDLRKCIPCNIDMSIGLVRTSHQPMYMGSVARVGKITTITPSNQVTINVQNNNEMYVGTYVRTVKKVTIGGN